jgi:hypothetical protein
LDSHGFKYVPAPTSFLEWGNREAVEKTYLPDIEKILLDSIVGADEVAIFDWRVCELLIPVRTLGGVLILQSKLRESTAMVKTADLNDPSDALGPAKQAHVGMKALITTFIDFPSETSCRSITLRRCQKTKVVERRSREFSLARARASCKVDCELLPASKGSV